MAINSCGISSLVVNSAKAQHQLSEGSWIRREHCSYVTPNESGGCQYTVTTGGDNAGLNIHFDLSDIGDKGITWRVSKVVSFKAGFALLETDLVVTRLPHVLTYLVKGTCSVGPVDFKCISSDGQFQSYGSGVVRR